ncbi:hypothetical protein O7626_05920 [Micromonospora sp. WMMD1102]|uniref:hypothetical protein n=1 Tax=Micromonospora sp. WMMD1102 TaxID=3016105 RepID=UPI00241560A4|nr:hypothetical protein [Micromonospora sp. WMMD1102]MDG4785474.1 hypothetical protein [Micromonospora sp. WMMD1102]
MTVGFVRTGLVTLSLAAVAVLGTACQPAKPSTEAAGTPTAAPSTAAPSPTAAAPNTREVCAAVTDIFVDGSVKIADDSVKAIEKQLSVAQQAKQLKTTLAGLADQLEAEAAKATDPEVKALVEEIVADIESGAKAKDPVKYLQSDFVKVGTKIDKECTA